MKDYSAAEIEAMFTGTTQYTLLADVPHTRPGHPPYLLLTGRQWDNYLGWQSAWDEVERKYGGVSPSLFSPSMRATARRIW